MLFSDLQKKMTSLLAELDELLKANNVEYMLYSGSQLGADRHHGMIPWDDDVDILMSLENYDRFIELAKTSLPEGRSVNALELSTEYPFCYGRYVDLTTTALQRHTLYGTCDPGVKIDVFFAVPTHPNKRKAKKHQLEILAFNEVLADNVVMIYRRPEEFFPYYEKEKKLFNKLGRDAYVKKRLPELKYKYAKGFRKPQTYIFFSGMVGNSHFIDVSEVTNSKRMRFEDIEVQGAANGPYYNIENYGESWYQIPGNISKPHHLWASDINTPFSEHLKAAADYFDLDKLYKIQKERKQLSLEQQLRFKDAFIFRENLKNLAIGMSIDKRYHSEGADLPLPERFKMFSAYYGRQLCRENKWYKLIVPLSDDTLAAALDCLVSMGDFGRAISILDLLDGKAVKGSDDINRRIHLSRELFYATFVYPDQLEQKEHLIEANADTVDLTVPEAKGRLMLKRMQASSDREERAAIARSVIEHVAKNTILYGECSELRILKAFVVKELEAQGETVDISSAELFQMDIAEVRNGFILQEIIDEGFDIIHVKDDMNDDDDAESALGGEMIHHYLPEADYNAKKRELTDSPDGSACKVKGSGSKEYIVVYRENSLDASIPEIIKGNAKDMSKREFWHICGPDEARVEYKPAAVYADNISPEDYLQRAKQDGLLNTRGITSYNDYRKWLKSGLSEINREYKEFQKDFEKFMTRT